MPEASMKPATRSHRKKVLYLHIGTHKTGTTAIQSMLKRCQAGIAAQGVNTIHIEAKKLKMALRCNTRKRGDSIRIAQRILKQGMTISRLRSPRHITNNKFILSWGGLCGTPSSGYSEAGHTADIISAALKESFETRIIIFLRRQDLFAESMYAQYIRQGMSFSFQEFMNKLPDKAFDWGLLIDSYAESFGEENISVIPYEKEGLSERGSLISLFCKEVDIDATKLTLSEIQKAPSAPNQAWTKEGIELARQFAMVHPDDETKRALRHLLDEVQLTAKDKSSFLSWEDRIKLLSDYRESNHRVLKKYVNGSRVSLFSEPAELIQDAATTEYDNHAAQLQLMAALIAHLANNQRPRKMLERLLRRQD